MKPKPWLVAVLVGAVVGFAFAGLSTYDFVQHLDRQVHALHCSFIPGAGSSLGESGCQVAMMSEYSSIMRSKVWGGIPISLPAMAVFGFIACFAIDLLLSRRQRDPRATAFLALATALPAATSLLMLVISLTQLGTTCKLCVGIYLASAVCLTGAIVTWRRAVQLHATGSATTSSPAAARKKRRRDPEEELPDEPAWTSSGKAALPRVLDDDGVPETRPQRRGDRSFGDDRGDRGDRRDSEVSYGYLAGAFGIGVAFVLVPVLAYLSMAPDHARFVGTCETLPKADDTYGIMVQVERSATGAVPSIEILDPLCPACRAFEKRLGSSGMSERLDRKAVLFPLDNTCNWMVTEATHPGACTISEAVLCAKDRAPEVIAWAFEEQDRIRTETKADPTAAARIVKARFPELAACVGSADAKSRLNKSLRWAVVNNIRVLTPQLFIDNVKLCDEDVDLGLEFSLGIMLDRHANKTLAKSPAESPATAKPIDPHGGMSGHAGPASPSGTPGKSSGTGKSSDKSSGTKSSTTDKSSGGASEKGSAMPPDSPGPVTSPSGTDPKPVEPTPKPDDKPADKPIEPKPAPKPDDQPVDKPADPKPEGGTP